MDVILIVLLGGVAGFFLPWWILVIGFFALVNLYLTYKRGGGSDSAYIRFLYSAALFVGLVVGCLASVLLHSHFVSSLHI
jgi:4-hydroxybenzoate polyprenyltransferase